MEVRIGVTYSAREIEVDLGDDADVDEVQKNIEATLKSGSMLWLSDRKGRRVGVPGDKVAYVEIGSERSERRVGFVG